MRPVSLILIAAIAFAQDPYRTAPNNYKLEFENDWVRVSRVSYKPGDKLPVHDHPAVPTVYVYTTDGGPILFGHQEFQALRRPEVKAGQIRFSPGNRETHTTEYLGDKPSEYLRIELKTETIDRSRKPARIAADDMTPLENGVVRIERVTCPCGAAKLPSVAVTTTDRKAHWVTHDFPPGPQIQVMLKTKPR